MDDLKQGVRLQGYGNNNPVDVYKRESLDMFEEMVSAIQDELSTLPPGTLYCTHNGNYTKWYHQLLSQQFYIPKKEKNFAQVMARKKYLELKLQSLSFERQTIRTCIDTLASHPSKIEFITSPLIDSYRRDFTINAIYFDKNGNIFDPQNGVLDLNNHLIRIIGNPQTRIKEDPLRIIRAYRFKNDLNFEIESTLFKAICDNKKEIQKLSKGKIEEEKHKCKIPFSKDILIFLNI